MREHLASLDSGQLDQDVQNRRSVIDELTRQMNQRVRNVNSDLRRLRTEQRQLDIALASRDDEARQAHFTSEWEQLRVHPRLAKAKITAGQLELTTTDDLRLHCEGREDTRWLGAFRITISPMGEIKLDNLSTRRGGRDHPHVIEGQPCFGGDHNAFTQLLTNGDLFVLFEMLLQYLETLNLRDEYGRFGSYWFDAPDARPLEGDATAAAA